MSAEGFKTPRSNKNRVRSLIDEDNSFGDTGRIDRKSNSCSPSRQITVPSSPCLERLGYGTGVSVYLMERSPLRGTYRSPWAVKKVARRFAGSGSHQDFSGRLLQEAEILRSLQHPNIIGFRTLTKAQDGAWCLAMERAHHCLMDLIEERLDEDSGPFPSKIVEVVALDIAKALDYLHTEKRLMHGDLKSGNILIFGHDLNLAKLCDFGVALPLAKPGGAVQAGHYYVGTQAWSAPEVIASDEGDGGELTVITAKADMFSYGLTLWEMLSLQLPHADLLDEEEDDDTDYKAALGSRPPLPELPNNGEYSRVIAIFIAATEALALRRPKAGDILRIFDTVSK